MTCRTFLETLDEFLEGRLSESDRRMFEEHLQSCDDCRDLGMLTEETGVPVPPPAGFVREVLRRTSGSTCGSARVLLCDHVDRLLAPTDDELVRMHIAGCHECSGLASALARIAVDLPLLAEVDPGGSFVAAVLASTSRRPRVLASWAERLASAWQGLAHRPRIAWEGAFAGWMILILLFGTSGSPFAGVPDKAIVLAKTVRESVGTNVAGEEAGRIGATASQRFTKAKAGIEDTATSLKAETGKRVSSLWTGLKKNLGTAWARLASGRATNEKNRAVDADDTDGREPR